MPFSLMATQMTEGPCSAVSPATARLVIVVSRCRVSASCRRTIGMPFSSVARISGALTLSPPFRRLVPAAFDQFRSFGVEGFVTRLRRCCAMICSTLRHRTYVLRNQAAIGVQEFVEHTELLLRNEPVFCSPPKICPANPSLLWIKCSLTCH